VIHEVEVRNDDHIRILIPAVLAFVDAQNQDVQSGLALPDLGISRIAATDSSVDQLLRNLEPGGRIGGLRLGRGSGGGGGGRWWNWIRRHYGGVIARVHDCRHGSGDWRGRLTRGRRGQRDIARRQRHHRGLLDIDDGAQDAPTLDREHQYQDRQDQDGNRRRLPAPVVQKPKSGGGLRRRRWLVRYCWIHSLPDVDPIARCRRTLQRSALLRRTRIRCNCTDAVRSERAEVRLTA